MKPLKITQTNAAAIEAALLSINGRSSTHCITSYAEIAEIAENMERWLARRLPKKLLPGASVTELSGAPVSNAYAKKSFSRNATRVCLERRSSAWFLTSINADTIYQQGGYSLLYLTAEQDAEIIKRVRSNYLVRP